MSYGTFTLQDSVAANGNGVAQDASAFPAGSTVEIAETAGGTATVTLQGSFDGTNWYSLGYQRIDAQATVTRAVAALSVSANTRTVFQLLDAYPQLRAAVSSVAGGAVVTVKLFAAA